jgi:hypothetical protein
VGDDENGDIGPMEYVNDSALRCDEWVVPNNPRAAALEFSRDPGTRRVALVIGVRFVRKTEHGNSRIGDRESRVLASVLGDIGDV